MSVGAGSCSRSGCNRLAVTADIDHLLDWHYGGRTNVEGLAPACRGDHRLRHAARFTVTKARDGTTTWKSPTGRSYTQDPPF